MFQPITTKLDDVIASNLKTSIARRRPSKTKGKVPDYGLDIEDEVEDINLDDLFDETVLPQQEKQLVATPATYEESLEDILAGNKEIYMDPQYFPQEPQELPPEYDNDEVEYALDDEDVNNEILNDLGLQNYDSVDKVLNQPEMTKQNNRKYLNTIIDDAKKRRNQLKGYKASVTKQFKRGSISESVRQIENRQCQSYIE